MTTREKFRPVRGAPRPIGMKSVAVPISAAESAFGPLNWIRVFGGLRESHGGNNFQSSHPDLGIAFNHLNFNHITFFNRHTPAYMRLEGHSLPASALKGCHPGRRAEPSSPLKAGLPGPRQGEPGRSVEGPLLGCSLRTSHIQESEEKAKGEEKANRKTRPLDFC